MCVCECACAVCVCVWGGALWSALYRVLPTRKKISRSGLFVEISFNKGHSEEKKAPVRFSQIYS